MDPTTGQSSKVWALAARQHGLVARSQLLAIGYGADAITHRLARGRLYPVGRGVYAVGRREVTRHGRWMAAVLACGPGAALSHESAAALWRIADEPGFISVSLPAHRRSRPPGLRIHRRATLGGADVTIRHGIPSTSPVRTLLDLAVQLPRAELEAAINAADKHELVHPESLRAALANHAGQPGVRRLRELLDRRTFTLTDSELERRFLPIAREAGLPTPRTQARLNGFRVDFLWPELRLVVETDGLLQSRSGPLRARARSAHPGRGRPPARGLLVFLA